MRLNNLKFMTKGITDLSIRLRELFDKYDDKKINNDELIKSITAFQSVNPEFMYKNGEINPTVRLRLDKSRYERLLVVLNTVGIKVVK